MAATIPSPSEADADRAGLRYVIDTMPGIRRRRAGRGFTYIGPDGARLTDAARLAWIRRLAIPPAWTDVWICPLKHGHIQATGRDARGRKQYRYHPRWREVRDAAKFDRLLAFARVLPAIRRATNRDLRRPGLPREKVLALVVRLLEATLMRVGNEEYVRENRSYGLSTLRERHVDVRGARVRLSFRGKLGREHEIELSDARLARVIRQCQELPGQALFQYTDADGARQAVDSGDVNEYLREITGEEISAKDFRTWAGTVATVLGLAKLGPAASEAAAKRNLSAAIEGAAAQLGNTPTVCRACYVHPDVIDAYTDGTLIERFRVRSGGRRPGALTAEEAAVVALLRATAVSRGRRRAA